MREGTCPRDICKTPGQVRRNLVIRRLHIAYQRVPARASLVQTRTRWCSAQCAESDRECNLVHDVCNVRKQQRGAPSCMLCRVVNLPKMAPVRDVCPSRPICRARWATRPMEICSVQHLDSAKSIHDAGTMRCLRISTKSGRTSPASFSTSRSGILHNLDQRRLLVGSHYYEGFRAYVLPVTLSLLRVHCADYPAVQARLRPARSGYQCQTAIGKTSCVCDDVTFDLPRERALVASLSS